MFFLPQDGLVLVIGCVFKIEDTTIPCGQIFYYVFTAVPLRLIFALLVAMLLKPPTRATSIYTGIYYLPSLIGGSVAVAIMWRQIFGVDGLINFILKNVGIGKE